MKGIRAITSSAHWLDVVVAAALLVATASGYAADKSDNRLISISLLPEKITVVGADRTQQVVVTGHFDDGGVRDLTPQATLDLAKPQVARVDGAGLIVPLSNGNTQLTAEYLAQQATAPITVAGMDGDQPIHFVNDIVPIFSKLGCNSGNCHGKSGGQNGFRMSLMGFEPSLDYATIVREAGGRRVTPIDPERSLLLLKPTASLGHGGGKLLEVGSTEYKVLRRWIGSGTPYGGDSDRKLVRISVAPEDRLLTSGTRQQIIVTAHYSDGSTEDVTRRVEYSSNQEELLGVSKTGLIEAFDLSGGGSIMARYQGQVAIFRATVPTGNLPAEFPEPNNFVDDHVFARLKRLGIPPSALCNDCEFMRRVSIDITGTLPSPAEVESFVHDQEAGKRERLVAALVERPEYAKYFALKWSDVLRNKVGNHGPDYHAVPRVAAFHTWIRQSLEENKPYNQFVREIVTAAGDVVGDSPNPPVAWYTHLYKPETLADDTAQVFLGTQINCAQCHHHPYEKWSQDDYWSLAAFFGRVQWEPAGGVRLPVPEKCSKRISLQSKKGVSNPQNKRFYEPRVLEGDALSIALSEDPRQKLVNWMEQPDNPYFARALVNRYWSFFFSGRGIVDPVDDMRATNPPSNPELLDALAADFVEHRFDLKHLVRTICTSKTYQLCSLPNAHNQTDMQNFSRHMPQRLQAEVLLDAIDRMIGCVTPFEIRTPKLATQEEREAFRQRFPFGRALDLPVEDLITPNFLTLFGKPARDTASACERSFEATLDQSLYLLNSQEIQNKLSSDSSRAAQLVIDTRDDTTKINDLYLLFYGRPPATTELQNLQAYLHRKAESTASRREAFEDILWALLNSKEFLFNH